jgi:hypothetical protein
MLEALHSKSVNDPNVELNMRCEILQPANFYRKSNP